MRDETIEVGAQHVEMEMGGRGRVEVIRGVERRRRWSNDEKARITSESFRPGASVSDVARRHGMSLGLLHHWRRAVRREAGDGLQTFVPLLPAEGPGMRRRRKSSAVQLKSNFAAPASACHAPSTASL